MRLARSRTSLVALAVLAGCHGSSPSSTPKDSTFTVGGTVAGLLGSGLVLTNGGGDPLAVAPGSTSFTFAAPLAAGAAYEVAVSAQPTHPAQTCAVAGGSGRVGAGPVTSVAVTCTGPVVQAWVSPATWGAPWPDGAPTLVEHARFDGSAIVETKGISWTTAGTAPGQRAFGGFPGGPRHGAGPFDAGRFQAAAGDAALSLPGDMTVCAVVKPELNPRLDGYEGIIVAKGLQGESGWVLMQMHDQFCFHYQAGGAGSFMTPGQWMITTSTHLGDAISEPPGTPNRELNPSYVVVCAGRDGDTIRLAANGVTDTMQEIAITGAMVAPTQPATIGGYANGDPNHAFHGRVYETAVWKEAATPRNLQAKLAAFQGLTLPDGSVATYLRPGEAPFVGVDGQYHTTWLHGPRLDPVKGLLFGLQGYNRIADPEALDRWTAAGGATVVPDQREPPGDSERASADRVTLASGATLTATQRGTLPANTVLQGQLWVRAVSASGTVLVKNGRGPGVDLPIDLATLGPGWSRVFIPGLASDVAGQAAFTLTTASASVTFDAWGAALTEVAGGGDLGGFDPGPSLYSSGGTQGTETIDKLLLPPLAQSTGSGYCLSVQAAPAEHLPWSAAWASPRVAAEWMAADGQTWSQLRVAAGPSGQLCLNLATTARGGETRYACAPTTGLADGSSHEVKGCVTPSGELHLYLDGAAAGTAGSDPPGLANVPPPDLAGGQLTVGSGAADHNWSGWLSRALVCRGSDPGPCAW